MHKRVLFSAFLLSSILLSVSAQKSPRPLPSPQSQPRNEDQDVVRYGDRRRHRARDRRIEIADNHLNVVDINELLRALDARLRAALAILRVCKLNLDPGEAEPIDGLLDLFDTQWCRLVPRLAIRCGIAGQAGENAVLQFE